MDFMGGRILGLGGADCITIAGDDTMERVGAGRVDAESNRCGGATMVFR